MKRVFHIAVSAFAFLVFLATSGTAFYTHHCNREGKSFVSLTDPQDCCITVAQHNCCQSDDNGHVPDANTNLSDLPCCTTDHIFLVVENDFQVSRKQELPVLCSPAEVFFVFDYIEPDVLNHISGYEYTCFLPPGPTGRQLVFLLHQPKIPSPFIA